MQKQRKQTDVYICFITTSSINVEWNLNLFIGYCNKKTMRLTGVFIDYVDKPASYKQRPSFQNFLKMEKPKKYIVCVSGKDEFDKNELDEIEKIIKDQGGTIYYYWDTIKERNRRENERMELKIKQNET